MNTQELQIQTINIYELIPSTYNPRKWSPEALGQLTTSIREFGLVDPILANSAKERKNIVIGGHFRLKVAKDLGLAEVPVVYVNLPEEARERELNLRLNKNQGEWDTSLLAEFDQNILSDIGFSSEELDDIFIEDTTEKPWDIDKALEKAGVETITAKS